MPLSSSLSSAMTMASKVFSNISISFKMCLLNLSIYFSSFSILFISLFASPFWSSSSEIRFDNSFSS